MADTPKRDFNRAALTWDANPGRMKMAADIGTAITARVELTPTMRVLDFGCGTGLLSLGWADRIGSLTGADTSTGMLSEFNAKVRQHDIDNATTHLIGDATGLPAGPYDLVVSSMTLHHIADVPALLHQLHAVLAPGGRIALADLDPDEGLFHSDNTGVCHFGFAREQMRQWLMEAGFTSIEDCTASQMNRKTSVGERVFTLFLVVAEKPASK